MQVDLKILQECIFKLSEEVGEFVEVVLFVIGVLGSVYKQLVMVDVCEEVVDVVLVVFSVFVQLCDSCEMFEVEFY